MTTTPRPLLATAAAHLTRDVPVCPPSATAGDLRRALVGRRFDTLDDIAVLSDGLVVGLVRIEDLVAAPDGAVIADLMDDDPPTVREDVDQEVVAWKAVERAESCLVVVDGEGRFLGLIPPHRLLSVLLREHDEDLARFGGFAHDIESARLASEEPVFRRFRHRLPWLLVGLAGALAAARIMGRFEDALAANVVLAFFLPGIVYMADAVGTQTETLLVRGLSVGVGMRGVARGELATGLLVGASVAAVFLPVGLALWDEPRVIVAAALALFAACSTATVVAMILPVTLRRMGVDPAFGSGPLATVVQDLLSLLIYLGIASALM